jgi:hypothetical protein
VSYTSPIAAIEALAQTYLQTPILELEERLAVEVGRAAAGGLPHRGSDQEFWRRARDRLVRDIARQQVAASATAGVAAGTAVQWAQTVGLDLTTFRIPIGILVALVVGPGNTLRVR